MQKWQTNTNLSKQEVNHFDLHLDSLAFKAGNVQNRFQQWMEITQDPYVLSIIKQGVLLDFSPDPDLVCTSRKHIFSGKDKLLIIDELTRLLKLGVIAPSLLKPDSYVSNIFTTEKSDRTHRLILNLKELNEQINYVHFKMESLGDVLNMLTPHAWMASIDLKDAYYSIPINPLHRKYFAFWWGEFFFEYTCLPNGTLRADDFHQNTQLANP